MKDTRPGLTNPATLVDLVTLPMVVFALLEAVVVFPYASDFPDGPSSPSASSGGGDVPVCKVPVFTCGFVSAAICLGVISLVLAGMLAYACYACAKACLRGGEDYGPAAEMLLDEEEGEDDEPLIAHV